MESHDAINLSFENISGMDKRGSYRHLFQTELVNMIERKNAKQLHKQARGQ